MANWTYYIYALQDPITEEIRYVGRTENLAMRYYWHWAYCGSRKTMLALNGWLKELKAAGVSPRLVILAVLPGSDDQAAAEMEMRWINIYLEQGCQLLNRAMPRKYLTIEAAISALNTFTDQQIMEVKAYIDSRMGQPMFTQFTSTQPVADQIKGLVSRQARLVRRISPLLTEFERAAWYPAAFEDAAKQAGFQYNGVLNYAGNDVIAAVEHLIKIYLAIIAKG